MSAAWDAARPKFAAAAEAQDWERAEAILRRVAERKDAPPAVFYNLGKVLLKRGEGAKAGPWFRRAVAGDPGYPPSWVELGRWHAERREFAEALGCFRRAARLMPRDPDTRRLAGRAALAARDWRAAWEAFGELARLLPGDGEALVKGYQAAAELRLPEAERLRDMMLAEPGLRGAAINTTIRVSAGRLPLRPLARRG